MNRIETIVYNAVRNNPSLKQTIRNLYQGIFDLLPRKKQFFAEEYDYKEGYFFGFHDVSPLSKDESRLLAQHNSFDLRMPLVKESLEIGYFDFDNGIIRNWHKLGESYAWNYHKGCRLQWLSDNQVIFNTGSNGNLGSMILNTNTGVSGFVDYPIDSVFYSKEKKIASSFSYERLERCMPGYGYPYKDGGYIDESAPENTGLFIIDLTKNERRLLLNLREIAVLVTGKIEEEYLHFVTHTEFSPDGRFISFLYRRIPKEGDYMKRKSIMCVYDFKDEKLIVLPTQESGSHYVWNHKNEILASVNLNTKNCHAIFHPEKSDFAKMIDPNHLNSDGHQSFITDSEFLTDTYPDKWRMAKLYRTNIDTEKTELIASLYSPKKFQTKDFHCHIACDLHPRVIGNGKYVCFDSPCTGKRGIYVMKLNRN